MTTVLRIIRRGYPPLSLPCWLEPTFLENWLRFHESSLSLSLRSLCLLRKRRRERVAEEGETMTWSWLTNGNSFPLQPRSRLIIFSETSTFNWCFLIDCPSQAGARTTKAFETRISRCSNSVWQVSFAPRTSLLWTYLSVCPLPLFRRELVKRVAEVGFIGYYIEIYGYETRGEEEEEGNG